MGGGKEGEGSSRIRSIWRRWSRTPSLTFSILERFSTLSRRGKRVAWRFINLQRGSPSSCLWWTGWSPTIGRKVIRRRYKDSPAQSYMQIIHNEIQKLDCSRGNSYDKVSANFAIWSGKNAQHTKYYLYLWQTYCTYCLLVFAFLQHVLTFLSSNMSLCTALMTI